ncbi:ABC transporter ATP-binding protein [Paenibacillus sp. Marseille-P2973]|uniref:ABC transporter ATP-binding protein n=1 Tax=Paenibacillus sp. Marseille-P2973 TaxID=1871032 RepID=UPI001B36DD57|nr:ABC transporter ATP-binding protein [Paenibacillus sp. Marseille-P2973]MBQ4900822.1 ABC transporter ATP-binding protein [Paenibacillus sp. Marseille-P2973]
MKNSIVSSSVFAQSGDGNLAIALQDVFYTYEGEAGPAIDGISLAIRAGEWVTIAGPSGCGKSTLGALLSGYLPRAGGGSREGRVTVGGFDPASAEIADLAGVIGIVFQDPDAQLVQGRLEDEVAFGPENLCLPVESIERRVTASLQDADLLERRRDNVNELSGGGRQRAAVASVLALEPPILVLDEAAASLDAASRQRLLALLRRLHQSGRTLVTLTGRLDELALAAPRLVVLAAGRVAADGAAAELLRDQRPLLSGLGLLPQAPGEAPSGEAAPAAAADARPGAAPLLELRGLSFAYGAKGRRRSGSRPDLTEPAVLKDVHMQIHEGEWHILRGDNGSGKTTLSRLMLGLLPAPSGAIFWRGRDASRSSLYELAEDIGYVFQHPDQQFVASTVLDELLYGPRCSLKLRAKDATPEPLLLKAKEMLRMIGLEGREQASPYVLGGGEKRLLSAAAGFMTGKRLILLDEPTAGTDYAGARLLSALCRKAVSEGTAILMITHEPEFFAGEQTKIWTLDNGKLREN